MNKEEPFRDQAERLKQRIEKINEKTECGDRLPPREQLHRQKQKKTKWKLKYPVIRLLVLLFILLPITCVSIISYYHGKKISGSEKVTGNNAGYETINIENSKQDIEKKATNPVEDKETVLENNESISSSNKNQDSANQVQLPKNSGTTDITSVENPITNDISKNEEGFDKSSNIHPNPETSSNVKSEPTGNKTATSSVTRKIVYHTVQPKETLYRIAIKYYHSKTGIDVIKGANQLRNNQIQTGQILKIPLRN